MVLNIEHQRGLIGLGREPVFDDPIDIAEPAPTKGLHRQPEFRVVTDTIQIGEQSFEINNIKTVLYKTTKGAENKYFVIGPSEDGGLILKEQNSKREFAISPKAVSERVTGVELHNEMLQKDEKKHLAPEPTIELEQQSIDEKATQKSEQKKAPFSQVVPGEGKRRLREATKRTTSVDDLATARQAIQKASEEHTGAINTINDYTASFDKRQAAWAKATEHSTKEGSIALENDDKIQLNRVLNELKVLGYKTNDKGEYTWWTSRKVLNERSKPSSKQNKDLLNLLDEYENLRSQQ